MCSTLHSFDSEEEITDFVCCKINSVIATEQENLTEGIYDIFETEIWYSCLLFLLF